MSLDTYNDNNFNSNNPDNFETHPDDRETLIDIKDFNRFLCLQLIFSWAPPFDIAARQYDINVVRHTEELERFLIENDIEHEIFEG